MEHWIVFFLPVGSQVAETLVTPEQWGTAVRDFHGKDWLVGHEIQYFPSAPIGATTVPERIELRLTLR
jgi:hypothetical protein